MRTRVFKALACLAFSVCLLSSGCDVDDIAEQIGDAVKEGVKGTIVEAGTAMVEAAVAPWFE